MPKKKQEMSRKGLVDSEILIAASVWEEV